MASLNKVLLIGNLGNDPEIKMTPSGQKVANFSVATNEFWTDKSGAKQERTEWHRIVVWGRQAETCEMYLRKGRTVFIDGRIQTRQWEDTQGQKRYTTEIVASTIQFIGSGGDRAPYSADDTPIASPMGQDFPQAPISDDDVPF